MKEKEKLDYLLIPAGWKKQREERALKELEKREVENIFILNGFDSEEDILYLGRMLKGKERIGFVTFPLHYKEYIKIIRKAEKQGKFPKKIETENIRTKETPRQFIYGILSLLEEKMKKEKPLDYVKNRNENKFLLNIKKLIVKILKFPDKYQKELYYPK
jgi:hypothetical protein